MKPISPILAASGLAPRLGAVPIPITATPFHHAGVVAFLHNRACDAVAASGRDIPILGRDGGVWAWPIQPGARDTGAGL